MTERQPSKVRLRVEDLHVAYDPAKPVLRGISLSVGEGEMVAVIGPSGAGKSTLLRSINRLIPSSRGRILLDGQDVLQLKRSELRDLRRSIGMIFQSHALVGRLTVMENVLSGRLGSVGFWPSLLRRFPADDIRRALDILARVGIEGFQDQRADRLSGGQKQRVGIARALMQRPGFVLVDEPTASLDPRTSRQIMRLLREIGAEEGLTMLVNLHDVPLARLFADRIIGLKDGVIAFEGPPSELRDETLSLIYGEEDWTDGAVVDDHSGAEEPAPVLT